MQGGVAGLTQPFVRSLFQKQQGSKGGSGSKAGAAHRGGKMPSPQQAIDLEKVKHLEDELSKVQQVRNPMI